MKTEKIELLKKSFLEIGIISNEEIISKFVLYFSILKTWNEKFNLTSITKEEDFVLKHIVDSLMILKFINIKNENIIDIGTGAGFPGLPIKIVCPKIKITFVDSSNKKTNFIENICDVLKIENHKIVCDNIENLARDYNHREKYDFALSRALAEFSTIVEYGIPLLKINSKLLIYKGPNVEKEVENSQNVLNILRSKIVKSIDFEIPFSDYKRKIIVVEKYGKTDDKYPRKVGLPRKRPL